MVTWWVGAVAPAARLSARGAVALSLCVAVELSQLIHAPSLDAARHTPLGVLVLGSGFDVRDIGAYALGVISAVLLEWMVMRRGHSHETGGQ